MPVGLQSEDLMLTGKLGRLKTDSLPLGRVCQEILSGGMVLSWRLDRPNAEPREPQ